MAVFTSKIIQINQEQTPIMSGDNVSYMQVENLYYAEFECDTTADLPDQVKTVDTATVKGTITLVVGSKAHVIDTDEDYKLMSDGVWKLQRGTDVTSLVNAISQVEDDLLDAAADAAYARTAVDYFIRPKVGELIDKVGGKNLIKIDFASPYTNQNVIYTNNGDGTVSLSGTSTGFSYVNVATLTLNEGDNLHLNGCPSGGNYTTSYCLYIAKNVSGAATLAHEEGEGVLFTVPETAEYNVRILARNGTATSGLVYKPMLCTYEDWEFSQKFVPYIPTNEELYNLIKTYHP